jgi:hypothetical protein
MELTQHIGEAIFGLLFIPFVGAELIRLVAPRYNERMLKVAKKLRAKGFTSEAE